MTDRILYNLAIPSDSQTQAGSDRRANLATQSLLDVDVAEVEALSLDPGERRIEATIRGEYAAKVASELEELWSASGFDKLPYYAREGSSPQDGYYVPDTGSFEANSVHTDRVQRVEGTLRRTGTKSSHLRALRVTPAEVTNDWSDDTTAYVALPAVASNRRWFDRASKTTASVSVVETRTAAGGTVDIVDANDVGLAAPFELVYGVPYDVENAVGVVLWDTRGHPSTLDSDGVLRWQKCYRTDHGFAGVPVLDTGLLRLSLDTQAGLTAEAYQAESDSWSEIALESTDYTLVDYDITEMSPTSIAAYLTFADATSDAAYTLEARARRGAASIQFVRVEDSPPPLDVTVRLDPIAATSTWIAQPSQGLVKRSELRDQPATTTDDGGGSTTEGTAEAGQMQYGHASYGGH